MTYYCSSYRSVTVFKKWHKVAAFLIVICLNVFFVLFSMSRALQRGKQWQKAFIAASIAQMIVEILVYETTECIWLHYLIPSCIRKGEHLICPNSLFAIIFTCV